MKLKDIILAVANDVIPGRATLTILRQDGIEKWAYNDVHFEIQKFLDRIRQNEGMDTFLMRKDSSEAMQLEIGFSDHESMGAIVRELTHKASNISKRHGINTIQVVIDEGIAEDFSAAVEALEAMCRQAGTVTRTIQGEGWTEREALMDALDNDEREYGHQDGDGGGAGSMRGVVDTKMVRKPVRAKRVKIKKSTVRKGPVKKAFVLSRVWHGSSSISRDKRFYTQYTTQGDAMKAARELVLEYGEELSIDLKAFCVGDTHLANIVPQGAQPGLWRFKVDFRE